MPGGLPTELFIAWIIVSKFGDHLPFYRQAEIFKWQGMDLDRGTLGNWVGRACFHLTPVINHMRAHLRGADRIFVDETRAPVLNFSEATDFLQGLAAGHHLARTVQPCTILLALIAEE